MATVTFGKTGTRPYGVVTVNETATSTANNTSTLSISLVLKRPSAISSTATKSASCTVNGTKYTWSGSIGGSGDKTLISKTQTVTHNSDGTKTINISASIALDITWSGVALGTISGSGTMKLTDIPRYGTSVQSLSSKTETTIKMNWSSNATVDYIWYSINNGSSWTGVNVTDGTSGTYTISGLSANTKYNIKTRVRRKDSQLTTDSSALAVTTYAYPYASGMPNFTVGDKLTLTIYNPLSRSVTVNILGADGSQISNDTTTGTSISGYNNATVQSRLYASIPNTQSGKYNVKVTYGSQVTTKTGGTYTINKTACTPSISAVTYKDINSLVTAITNNDQNIVQNQSQVQYTATGLTAKNSATIKSCAVKVNNKTYALAVSGTSASGGNAVIDSTSDVTATVTLTDSRGLTATKSVTVTMLELVLPTALITMHRQSNYYSETDITINANYSSVDGKNQVRIRYRYKKLDDTSWSSYQTAQDGVQSTFTADNEFEWNVQVVINDAFGGTTTYNLILQIGMPIIYFDNVKLSTGFNCFPKEKKSVEVNGVNISKSVMTRSLSATLTNLTVNTYTIIPLDLSNSAGNKLTATNDGGIQIGANVSKVLVSGRMLIGADNTAGNRHFRIIKNSYSNNNTLAWTFESIEASGQDNITLTPTLADVSEGDVIYLVYYTPDADDDINGGAFGGRTSLTVETVE